MEQDGGRLHDTRILATRPLVSPAILLEEIEPTETGLLTVRNARQAACDILSGRSRRLLAIVGPCSIHDPKSAIQYALALKGLAERYQEKLFVVMRAYFEKPRTVEGWEGFITDPFLDGSHKINHGLREARKLLWDLAEMGLPAGTEMLDMMVPQYISDLISWTAIGARTAESQPHRKLASGLSMPVGFKNPVDGRVQPAIDAISFARRSHWFPSATKDGVAAHFLTAGNDSAHLILRGGSKSGPNYGAEAVQGAARDLAKAGLAPRLLVDCSHGNSQKDHTKQSAVLEALAAQIQDGSEHIAGVLIESHLVAGRQDVKPGAELVFGQSITDACVDLGETERMLERLALSLP